MLTKEEELKEKFLSYIDEHKVEDLLTEWLVRCAESGISPKKCIAQLLNSEVAPDSREKLQKEETSRLQQLSGEVKQINERISHLEELVTDIKTILNQKQREVYNSHDNSESSETKFRELSEAHDEINCKCTDRKLGNCFQGELKKYDPIERQKASTPPKASLIETLSVPEPKVSASKPEESDCKILPQSPSPQLQSEIIKNKKRKREESSSSSDSLILLEIEETLDRKEQKKIEHKDSKPKSEECCQEILKDKGAEYVHKKCAVHIPESFLDQKNHQIEKKNTELPFTTERGKTKSVPGPETSASQPKESKIKISSVWSIQNSSPCRFPSENINSRKRKREKNGFSKTLQKIEKAKGKYFRKKSIKCEDLKLNGEVCGKVILNNGAAKYVHSKSAAHNPDCFWACRGKGCRERFLLYCVRAIHEKTCSYYAT